MNIEENYVAQFLLMDENERQWVTEYLRTKTGWRSKELDKMPTVKDFLNRIGIEGRAAVALYTRDLAARKHSEGYDRHLQYKLNEIQRDIRQRQATKDWFASLPKDKQDWLWQKCLETTAQKGWEAGDIYVKMEDFARYGFAGKQPDAYWTEEFENLLSLRQAAK
jgi:hypothetical protein